MATMNNMLGHTLGDEGRSMYVLPEDRYVVTLASSYGNSKDGITSPEQAAAAALALTLDRSSGGSMWFVFDRMTGEHLLFEQGDFEDIMHARGMIT
jgi:hypothetical protein